MKNRSLVAKHEGEIHGASINRCHRTKMLVDRPWYSSKKTEYEGATSYI